MVHKLSLSWLENFLEEACESLRGNMDASEFYVPMRASWEQILYDTVEEYLAELTAAGLLRKEKIGVCHFFVNEPLYAIFTQRKS